MKFKLFLWHLGFYKDVCPFCGRFLLVHRSNLGIGKIVYTCPDDLCEFNGDK